jgi:O-antigen ligase
VLRASSPVVRAPVVRPPVARFRGAAFPSALLVPPHAGEGTQLILLWLMVFSSAFVVVDIAYNIASVLAVVVFMLLGLKLDRRNIPLILFLVVFNLAGLVALQPYLNVDEAREFMLGTCFVGTTAIFFALCMNENALQRLTTIKWGLIIGALVTSLLGIAGWLDVAGLGTVFTMYEGRVSATFRDPNVLGSFLVLPVLYLIHDFLHHARGRLLRLVMAMPILFALFLTQSRGSWAGMAIGVPVLIAVLFITAEAEAMRARLTLLTLAFAALIGLALVVVLSTESLTQIINDRFVLQKDYDAGPSGRFGNQLRALPELLSLPFGYGPNRHSLYFPENPHNTYLMAFSSYGWVGGLTFLAFIICTLAVSWRSVLARTPFQPHAIVMFSGLIPHLVQNFQIDTDRWRHLFLIYGLCWGLAAISNRWLDESRRHAGRRAGVRDAQAALSSVA